MTRLPLILRGALAGVAVFLVNPDIPWWRYFAILMIVALLVFGDDEIESNHK